MTIAGFSAVGELSYNGFEFENAINIDVDGEVVTDEADRATTYTRYRITCEFILHNDAGNDAQMQLLHDRLTQVGRRLRFRQKGFSQPIDTAATIDVKFGPKPRIVSWDPLGSSNAATIVWQCEVCLASCHGFWAYDAGRVMAFNYEVGISISEKGFTTRRITGYVEITNTRLKNRPVESVDRFRELASAEIPLGFRRQHDFNLSKDRSRLDFAITDTQIESPNPWPKDFTLIEGTHETTWNRSQLAWTRQQLDIRAETRCDVSPNLAWQAALTVLGQRIHRAEANKVSVLIDEIRIREDIFGYLAEISIRWRGMRCLKDILEETGMWEPIGTDWAQWRSSIVDLQSPRGAAKWKHGPADDPIVSTCEPGKPVINGDVAVCKPGKKRRPMLRNECPRPEQSYLDYRMAVSPGRARPLIRQAILQSPDDPTAGETEYMGDTNGVNYGAKKGTSDILQETGTGRYSYTLSGYAIRAGYQVPRPKLRKIGDATAQPVERGSYFRVFPVANLLGVPVYVARWVQWYYGPHSPRKVDAQDDIHECIVDLTAEAPSRGAKNLRF